MRISDWSPDVCSADLAVDANQFSAEIDQRTARVAGIDGRIGLDEAPIALDSQSSASQRADNSRCHRPSEAERVAHGDDVRSEEHTSELQSLMRISYAVFCLKKKNRKQNQNREVTKQQKYQPRTNTK